MVVVNSAQTNYDVFHIIFFIVLFSILIQGTLLPHVAKKLNMTDPEADVMKTFNDYIDDSSVEFIQFTVPKGHPWVGREGSRGY